MSKLPSASSRAFACLHVASALIVLLSVAVRLGATESTPSSTSSQPLGSPASVVTGSAASSTLPSPAPSDQTVKVKGTFAWQKKPGERHDLEGKLTQTSADTWKATWNFMWSNKLTTFEGIVHGNPMNGEISGTGTDPKLTDPKLKAGIYSFEGKATDGVWKFDCFQINNGGKQPQGNGKMTVQK